MAEYRVWRDGDEEEDRDGVRIRAADPEHAAEKWADHKDWTSAEFGIVGGQDVPVVAVRDLSGNTLTRWLVRGEAVPSYSATEVREHG